MVWHRGAAGEIVAEVVWLSSTTGHGPESVFTLGMGTHTKPITKNPNPRVAWALSCKRRQIASALTGGQRLRTAALPGVASSCREVPGRPLACFLKYVWPFRPYKTDAGPLWLPLPPPTPAWVWLGGWGLRCRFRAYPCSPPVMWCGWG